jgi:multiple sugar transport system substrate-binding protein
VPKLIEQFNSEHKNIVVKDVPMEWKDIAAKMPLAIKAGKGPDVAVAHGDDIATYAAQGLLLKSDEIVKSLGYDAAAFPEGLLAAGNYKGSQYAIPWSVTPLGFFINKDVLKQAGLDPATVPTDKDSYMKALAALKTAGVAGEWVDGYFFSGVMEFKSLLWQFGGAPYNADTTKATFNSEAGVKALTHMTDLIKEGYSPANVAQDGNINALVSGKTAFHWNGIWQTTNEALAKTDWTAAPVPQIGTQKAVWSSSTHWTFPNNKNQDTNKTAAAATFVKWMNDHSQDWASTGELPAQNTVRNNPALLAAYPKLKPFLDELPYAHYETAAPGITGVEAMIITAVNEAVLGKKSPKEALDDAANQADKLLAQNKSQYGG